MAITRLSSFEVFQSTLSNITKTSSELNDLQIQISSGYKSQNFAGIYENTSQYLQLKDQISRGTQYVSNNRIIEARLQTTGNVISNVIEIATQLKSLIAQRRNAAFDVGVFPTQLDSAWKDLTGQLNIQLEGRYLFAGGKTDTKPVDEVTFPSLATDGVPGQEYYHGDNTDLSVFISDGVSVTYNTRANDEGFKKIFAALASAKLGDEANDDAKFVQAFDFLEDGISDLIAQQAKTNSNILQIQDTAESLTSVQIYWTALSEDIANTDIVEASTQVAFNQGVLQASFQAFARINSLRLSEFL